MRYDRFRTANPTAGGRDALGEAPLLHGASEQAITQLRDTARETRLAARDWLFRVNEPADRLFIVLSGRLQVLAEEDGRVLRELGAGAALGELGLLTGTARSASVRAVRDCRLLEIDRSIQPARGGGLRPCAFDRPRARAAAPGERRARVARGAAVRLRRRRGRLG